MLQSPDAAPGVVFPEEWITRQPLSKHQYAGGVNDGIEGPVIVFAAGTPLAQSQGSVEGFPQILRTCSRSFE